jgi:TonB family protein
MQKHSPTLIISLSLSLILVANLAETQAANKQYAGKRKAEKAATRRPGKVLEREVDLGPYMRALQAKIKWQWHPKSQNISLRGVTTFKINRQGNMSLLKMQKSTGNKVADEDMLEAVRSAAPFTALPAGSPECVEIEFTFDYNVWEDLVKMRKEGIAILKKAISELEQAPEKNESLILKKLHEMGRLHTELGEYTVAEPVYKQIIETLRAKNDEKTLRDQALALGNLGTLYYLQKRFDEATQTYKEALPIVDKLEKTDKQEMSNILEGYAKVLYVTNHTSEANQIYERVKKLRSLNK